jgi:RNA polymerase sigma factor (sigma-70 family)
MWRLTEDQRALAGQYYYIAQITARLRGDWSYKEETLSDSCLGLCNAAHSWKPDGGKPFRDYAILCCKNEIICGVKRRRRQKRTPPPGKHVVCIHKFELPELNVWIDDTIDGIDRKAKCDRLDSMKHLLTPTERLVVNMTQRGLKPTEIERKCGVGRNYAHVMLYRATERIKKELAR